jgi:pyruvate dehydrogenase E1 component alpha subunit
MLRIRLCEESFVEPILRKEIVGPVHLYVGEEAIATGVCAALKEDDLIFGNHRSHGHYLAKGGSLKKLIAEVYGKETGCSRGRGGSMHIIAKDKGFLGSVPIVAGTISLALGAALAIKIKKEKRIAVSFFGDGATGEGVLYESLNFASLKKLPILFVCENNLYSTHLPIREIRPRDNIFEIAKPFGIKTFRVDGNDVLKVYEISKKVIDWIKKGNGPSFIEFRTYRLRGHVGPDDNIQGTHTDIRPKKEIEKWKKRDPLKRFEQYLLRKNIFTGRELEKIKKEVEKEIREGHDFAKKSSYPPEEEIAKYVFK